MTTTVSRTWAVIAVVLLACGALPVRYFCATFTSATSGGATGYFAMRLRDTDASYGMVMDWTGFGMCDLSTTMVNYHIHSRWTNTTSDVSVGPTQCGPSFTGGHYDPTLQCTSVSEFASTLCATLGRTGAQYNCTPSLYTQGFWGQCEVGDLSAKFGPLTSRMVNIFNTDVRPANAVDYDRSWASLVFHCPSTRVLCGRLVEVPSWRACTGTDFPSSGAGAVPAAAAALAALLAALTLLVL